MNPAKSASEILRDPAFLAELEQAAQAAQKTPEQAQKYRTQLAGLLAEIHYEQENKYAI